MPATTRRSTMSSNATLTQLDLDQIVAIVGLVATLVMLAFGLKDLVDRADATETRPAIEADDTFRDYVSGA